jgi:transcriptional regulator with XRE-family HTH domain
MLIVRKKKSTVKDFGKRLAACRRQCGFSQRRLAEIVGTSGRMIAYYERESAYPPAHLLEPICRVLKTSADELLGLKDYKEEIPPEEWKLWRRFKKAEKLSFRDRRALFHLLNSLLSKNGPP